MMKCFPEKFSKLREDLQDLFRQKPLDLTNCVECSYYNDKHCSYKNQFKEVFPEEPILSCQEKGLLKEIMNETSDIIEIYESLETNDVLIHGVENEDFIQTDNFVELRMEYWHAKTDEIIYEFSNGLFKTRKSFEETLKSSKMDNFI